MATKSVILVLMISIIISVSGHVSISYADGSTTTGGSATLGGKELEYIQIPISYVTDRNLTGSKRLDKRYGSDRSEKLSYGICKVSIPRERQPGELKTLSFWRRLFGVDPTKYIVLQEIIPRNKEDFFSFLSWRISDSKRKKAFLFVHGYNVTFEDAARRTAQISYDLSFDGASVFYSWPSQGEISKYIVDETNIKWSEPSLKLFLEEFFTETGAENIYLIAHSMGNRALTHALSELISEQPKLMEKLTEIILAAPDIDAEIFKRDIAPMLVVAKKPITLYASSNDKALIASKAVHGYPRAGDAGEGLTIVDGIETIDASDVNTSFLGHTFYAKEPSVLEDIFYLVHHRLRANERYGIQTQEMEKGKYWVIER